MHIYKRKTQPRQEQAREDEKKMNRNIMKINSKNDKTNNNNINQTNSKNDMHNLVNDHETEK